MSSNLFKLKHKLVIRSEILMEWRKIIFDKLSNQIYFTKFKSYAKNLKIEI